MRNDGFGTKNKTMTNEGKNNEKMKKEGQNYEGLRIKVRTMKDKNIKDE